MGRCVRIGLAVILLGVLGFWTAAPARAACSLRDTANAARQGAEQAHDEYRKLCASAEMKQLLDVKFRSPFNVLHGAGSEPDFGSVMAEAAESKITPNAAEVALLKQYFEAHDKADQAEKAARDAEKVWYLEFQKKDEALTKAEKSFAEEQAWLEQQKAQLAGKPVDDIYLNRAAVIVNRLRGSYEGMKKDLKAYRECYPDVRAFLEGLDRRLARLELLQEEIDRRRAVLDKPTGDVASAPPAKDADADADASPPPAATPPPQNVKPEDWYVLEKVVVTPFGDKPIKADEKGASWTIKDENGNEHAATLSVSKAPPQRIHAGQEIRVELSINGDPTAVAVASWKTENFLVGPFPDSRPDAKSPSNDARTKVAVLHGHFGPGPEPRYNHHIWYNVGQDGSFNPPANVTWVYKQESPTQ